jgi:hypothetical protein
MKCRLKKEMKEWSYGIYRYFYFRQDYKINYI